VSDTLISEELESELALKLKKWSKDLLWLSPEDEKIRLQNNKEMIMAVVLNEQPLKTKNKNLGLQNQKHVLLSVIK